MTIDGRPTTTEPRSRRAILAGALTGLAGLIAGRAAAPDLTQAAAGDPLIIGNTTNNAGSANTTLTTSSTGTALLITQNGSGTALRGSAVGPGSIAGFFTANNGTGISGVTGNGANYGVFAQNNGSAGSAGALRASGGNNHGLVATTARDAANAVKAINSSVTYGGGVAVRAIGGQNHGVVADTEHDSAFAIRASNSNSNGIAIWAEVDTDLAPGSAVHAENAGAGYAIVGEGTGTGGGMIGKAAGDAAVGVTGSALSTSGMTQGVSGFVTSATGAGVSGTNDGAAFGGGQAILATGNKNHGVVASTADLNANAVVATINAEGGIAIFAENTSAGVDITAGSGIRALSGGGTLAHIHPGGLYNDGAGEFAGPIGVIGASTENSDGVFVGVLGLGGTNGFGVWGIGDTAAGVYGTSDTNPGVYGASNHSYGTYSLSYDGIGVYGQSINSIGVSGYSFSGYALYGQGNGAVTGTFSKGSGTFKIDHPLDPANKFLSHSFVESPDMMNIYNGIATLDAKGEATVKLPAWFGTLNKEFRYQLTPIGPTDRILYVKSKVKGNAFSIGGGSAGQEVSWQLTGIRQDAWANAHRVVVEETKPKGQKGQYLHPKENGQPESKGIGYAERKAIEAKLPKR